jgi:hypothetical protein
LTTRGGLLAAISGAMPVGQCSRSTDKKSIADFLATVELQHAPFLAVRSVEIPGLIAHPGIQRPLLTALDPRTAGCLGVPSSPLPAGLLERVDWPVGSVFATQT